MSPLLLAHTEFGGQGRPILILHGLFGSAKNWAGVGRHLAALGRPYALDLRNHGQSPRSPSHTLPDLVEDLREWIAAFLSEPPVLIGHSMGGLAAMAFALQRPSELRGLVIVDMAPRVHRQDYRAELQALRLDLSGFPSRTDIDRALAPLLPDPRSRQFFQTSIVKGPQGFRWTADGPALERSPLVRGEEAPLEGRFDGPSLLIRGGASPFVTGQDLARLAALFPKLRVSTIPGADHWVHVSAPQAFRQELDGFLRGPDLRPDADG